ncbi:MAG: hypothetical protein Q9217_000621 [Psora testacea]
MPITVEAHRLEIILHFDWLQELLILIPPFSDDVWLKGHTMHFSIITTRNGNELATEPPDDTVVESPNDADQAATVDTSYSTSEAGETEDPKLPELSDMIQGPWRYPAPQTDNVPDWIGSAYRTSRRFELQLRSKIEEVNVSVIDQKLQISLILPTGHKIDPPDSFFHNIYRVTLQNGEIWAVDATGAQYGYPDPLCPWRDFEQRRSGKINRECEFGYIRHQVYQSYGMIPVRHMVAQKIEKEELTNALEERFLRWLGSMEAS